MLTKEQIKKHIIGTLIDDIEDITSSDDKELSKLVFEALFELFKEYNSDAYNLKDDYKLVSDDYADGSITYRYEDQSPSIFD